MKTERLERISDILILQMNHWALYPLALTVIGAASAYTEAGGPMGLLWALCGLLALGFYLLRERVGRLWLFLLLHLALTAVFFVLPADTLVHRVICMACGAGYLVDSLVKRFRSEGPSESPISPVPAIAISAAAALLQKKAGKPDWDFYYTASLVSVLILYLFIAYIRRYLGFVAVNEKNSGCFPAADMFRSGIGLVALYAGVGAVILLLGSGRGWLGVILDLFKKGGAALLRFLISLIPSGEPSDSGEILSTAPPADPGLPLPVDADATSPFFEMLEYVAVALFLAGMAYALIRGILGAVRFLRQRFAERIGGLWGTEAGPGEDTDLREKCGPSDSGLHKKGRERGRALFGLVSYEERVRRLYRKRILSAAEKLAGSDEGREERLRLLTAGECGQKLGLTEMAEIYERTRYSGRETDREDVRQMKEACRQRDRD